MPILLFLGKPSALLAQERTYEWRWEMHPMWWWGWEIGMMAMMFLFWALIIVGLIVGIRWLFGKGKGVSRIRRLKSCVRGMPGARSIKMSLGSRRKILADKELEKNMSSEQRSWFRSRSGLVLLGFLAVAVFFLWEEHKAHLLGILPYVLLLLCPLMHLFHGGHGGHGDQHEPGNGGSRK